MPIWNYSEPVQSNIQVKAPQTAIGRSKKNCKFYNNKALAFFLYLTNIDKNSIELIDSINQYHNVFGWGTWIRTRTDAVRVRCTTVILFPTF